MTELDMHVELPDGRDENAIISKVMAQTYDLLTYLKFVTAYHTKLYPLPQPKTASIGAPEAK
jgi:hypothetical protein